MSVTIFLPREGNHLETTSMLMCFPSFVARVAPMKPVQRTRFLMKESAQSRPVLKKFRRTIWKKAVRIMKLKEADKVTAVAKLVGLTEEERVVETGRSLTTCKPTNGELGPEEQDEEGPEDSSDENGEDGDEKE